MQRLLSSEFLYVVLWHQVIQMINAARFFFTKKTWSLVFAALFMLTIHAPARADLPCSGGDDYHARPIAANLQPYASVFNPNGHFEVAMKSNTDLTTDITINHSLGVRQLFRSITRLKSSFPQSVVLGKLPVSEGIGFSLEIAEGGSGLTHICTYGFRFQQGVVSYRTLAARMKDRNNVVVAVGDVTAWKSVGSVGSQSTGLPSSDLLSRIDKALSRLPKPSAYLYETTSVQGQIVGTWTEMSAGILGTKDLRVAYDNFYQSSVEYSGMVEINLRRAKKAVTNNDPATGTRLLQAAQRYERQFHLNDNAAIEAYNGNLDAATELAKGIYKGSKAAVIYGSSMVIGPVGCRVLDTVFDVTDFAVEASDNGLSSATKKLVAGKITEMIFSYVPVATLNGKTLKGTIDRGVTRTLGNPEVYKIIRQAVSSPDFSKALMSFIAKSSAYTANQITEDQVKKIVTAILEEGASGTSYVTSCGSKWYQRLGLQLLEMEQATRGGYSFDLACQAHDACYGDCRTVKPECDKKLLADSERVCESAQKSADCIADAQIFFQAVSSEKGDLAFAQARVNCQAKPAAPVAQVSRTLDVESSKRTLSPRQESAGPMLQASTVGLSDAKFGMTVDAVERALGKKLSFNKGSRIAQCGVATIVGLSGVSLRFEDGRFIVFEITQPTVRTDMGFMMGNSEKDVIGQLQKDPTYIRGANRYDETLQEIIVGKSKFVVKGTNDGYWQGRVMKITSKRGKVTRIELGEASYVMLDEHEGDECAFRGT
jgi:hypothetical protein